jgi:hypothetical protein
LIQISTSQLIPAGVQLVINGYTNETALEPITNDTVVVYDLDPLVPGLLTNTYTYQVSIPNTLLYNATTNALSAAEIDLEFQGLSATNFAPDFVAAVLIRGQASEVAYVTPGFAAPTNTVNALTAQDYGGGVLLTWPPGITNYNILETAWLPSTNWNVVSNTTALTAELTGLPDPTLPMGTNWAFFAYTNCQMFFMLQEP